NRPTLAQIFEDNLTGEDFIVAVNHLKSKGSDCNSLVDYDLGDGAGNCNLTRTAAAEAMVDWLADETVFPGVEDILIIGDLNSYDKEDPIDAIKLGSDDIEGTEDDYLDMIHEIMGEMAYGYVFDGHTGYLDYALTNTKMANAVVDVDIWHINADEPSLIDYDMSYKQAAQDLLYAPDAYRSSDHDPVIISLRFPTSPVAIDDYYGVEVDTVLDVTDEDGLLANDSDPNGDPLTAVLVDGVDPVTEGTLVLQDNGSFTFTPISGFVGDVTFTYQAFDGVNTSNIATVTISVTHAPVANPDSYSTDEDIILSVSAPGVLENDTDVDMDSLTAILVSDVSNGTLVLNENGSFTYTPNKDYFGSDSFTYKAFDGALYSNIVEVTITINSVDDNFYIFLPIINR
ncbi:Ig-like domain-containing protein, partial [Vibrio sp.]|uniref:cadherin-like domain-containing protein n=1 Tax=Vibrio sp. TaxID=678 RepID=UPI003D0FF72A